MIRMHTASGRSRWPYVIAAAVLVVAAGIAIVYATGRGSKGPAAVKTPAASSAPSALTTGGASGAGDDEDDAPPTGCLGGQDRNAAMVLAAQKAADHTAYGAVEVATAFYRWLWQYPAPSAAESNQVAANIIAPAAIAAWKVTDGELVADGGNITRGVIPAGTPFHISTTNGIWRVVDSSTPDKITVDLAAGYVINGALSPTKSEVVGVVMVWQDGAWRVEGGTTVDQSMLANAGTRFTGGC